MNPHGGQVTAGLDFSVNINPLPLPEMARQALIEAIRDIHCYPEIDGASTIEVLSHYYQQPVCQTILGNGAIELIYLYARTLKPKKVVIISPTFNEYERAFRIAGAHITHYVLKADTCFKLDLNDFIGQLELLQPNCVVLCQPNNPTGQVYKLSTIEAIVSCLQKWDGHLMVDESFIELSSAESCRSLEGPIFCVQSLTKYYGIPNLRLGIGFSSEELINSMYEQKEPWSINGFALKVIETLLLDQQRREETRKWLEAERKYLVEGLSLLRGVTVYPTVTNFVLISVEEVKELLAHLRSGKCPITVRTCEDFIGLNEHYLRLAIKGHEENQVLIDKLKPYRKR